ncbi:MAG: FecR domain-containing protein, partial [Bacteroidales bacterium]|nr:FecR domain-containing protein [Bacteroidales bacterium]
ALYAGLAASFVAGIILCWFLAVAPLSDEASRMVAFHTDPGQRASLTLPDGTSVELNSGSTLEYPAVFARGERRVRVEGEAMFDVAKVADKPFYVETFAYDVKVLGTRFNVESDEDRGVFSTALMEGSVAILDKHDNRITELEPDQVVTLTDGRLIKRHEENIGSRYRWTDGIINCSGLSFEELMRRFERAFGVTIVIECEAVPDISYKRMKVNVCDGISHAFAILQRTSDFTVEYDDTTDTYHIR